MNPLLVLGTASVLSAAAGAAQAQQRVAMPLTNPGRPARLELSVFSGDVNVSAYDGNEIVIVVNDDIDVDLDGDDRNDTPRADGLRRIAGGSRALTVEEQDNTVSIKMDAVSRDVDLEITVPRMTSVHANGVNGDGIVVRGVTGEHELSHVNGDIVATDIAGSAVIGTTNGDVRVTITEVARDRPMSFSSFNGDVDVTLPANLAADLRVSSAQGDVFTDFDVVVEQEPPRMEQGADPRGGRRVRLERGMRAVIGGGGPEIRFNTFNGDVMIRKGGG